MLIHLMQHGASLSQEIDPYEPLSLMGREQIEKSARAAQILGLSFELIAASNKTRALQTAEIMAKYTGYPVQRIEVSNTIKAMAAPSELIDFIREYNGLDSVFIAGHLPSLGLVASTLLTGRSKLDIHIENGGLMQINYDIKEESGTLNWHLSPAQLTLIAKD